MTRALDWLEAHWHLVLVALLVAALVWSCNRDRQKEADLEARAAAGEERAAAAAAGVPVAQPVPDVRPQLEQALKENAQLRAELARANAAVPGAKPIAVVRAKTAPAPVVAPPAPAPVDPSPVPREVALFVGDELQLELDQVVLQGQAGAHLLVATLGARRAADGVLLAQQPISAPLTLAVEKAPPAKPVSRWRVGPAGGASQGGWLVGAVLGTPQARVPLVGWSTELVITGAAGPGGGVVLAGVPLGL